MRFWLPAMLLLIATLGGCADEPTSVNDHDDDLGDDDHNETAGPDDEDEVHAEANNTAPVANLTADVQSGTAPLLVNLSLDGSDADGDNLTWVLSVNGNQTANGTTLPAAFNFTFAAGNHTVVLAVSDGNATASANVTIAVLAGQDVPTGPCGAEPEPCKLSEDAWVEFWSDGTCEAKGERGSDSAGWFHDRPGTMPVVGGEAPYGTGFVTGGGTWVYEETNGKSGMQVHKDEGGAYAACVDGDAIIF